MRTKCYPPSYNPSASRKPRRRSVGEALFKPSEGTTSGCQVAFVPAFFSCRVKSCQSTFMRSRSCIHSSACSCGGKPSHPKKFSKCAGMEQKGRSIYSFQCQRASGWRWHGPIGLATGWSWAPGEWQRRSGPSSVPTSGMIGLLVCMARRTSSRDERHAVRSAEASWTTVRKPVQNIYDRTRSVNPPQPPAPGRISQG